MLSSVVLKRSTSDDVRAVWHERDISKIRFVAIDVNRILEAHRARAKLKRSAGGVNARRPCGTRGRSAAQSVDAAEHRFNIDARWTFLERRNSTAAKEKKNSATPCARVLMRCAAAHQVFERCKRCERQY